MTIHNPLGQFEIVPLLGLSVLGYDLSFTNLSLFLLLSTCVAALCLAFPMRRPALIPSKGQALVEMSYAGVTDLACSTIGGEHGKKFVPFIFCLFIFVLFANLCGMLPGAFATTSHISVTFALAGMVFITVTGFGLLRHGLKFFKLFLPEGCPAWLMPLILLIELFSFLCRPISLSLRLAANITSGHVLIHVMAALMASSILIVKPLPLLFGVAFFAFEFCVAVLQAYVFTILACVYISDVIDLH